MALTHKETEKYHQISEVYYKVNEAKNIMSYPYKDTATAMILSICKCVQSIMIGTEKYQKSVKSKIVGQCHTWLVTHKRSCPDANAD